MAVMAVQFTVFNCLSHERDALRKASLDCSNGGRASAATSIRIEQVQRALYFLLLAGFRFVNGRKPVATKAIRVYSSSDVCVVVVY
jgi:hypothetical protein